MLSDLCTALANGDRKGLHGSVLPGENMGCEDEIK